MAKFANSRWGLNFRDRDLKKTGRDGIEEFLVEKAHAAINSVDLSDGAQFLDPEFGLRSSVAWVKHKYGVELTLEDVRGLELPQFVELVRSRAVESYEQKEAEYPVMAAMYRYGSRVAGGHTKIDREALIAWARERFDVEIDMEDIKNKQREEIRDILVGHSGSSQEKADQAQAEASQHVEQLQRCGHADAR